MSTLRLSTYTSKAEAYLQTIQGKCQFQGALAFYGRTDRALAVVVMYSTRLRVYERIAEVVDALMGKVAA